MTAQRSAGTLLALASADPARDPSRIVEDLAWLGREAFARWISIAYEA